MASSASATVPVAKKARPNPARRRAVQAKAKDAQAINAPAVKSSHAQQKPKVSRAEPPKAPGVQGKAAQGQAAPTQDRNLRKTCETRSFPPPAQSKASALALAPAAIVTGGLLGCAAGAAFLISVGIWYDYAGVESAVLAAKSARLCLDNLADEIVASLKAGTYSSDEALDVLRRTTLAYASTIPGGTAYVERVFREINLVRRDRAQEVDKVLSECYADLSREGSKGADATQMREIVVRRLAKLSSFAENSVRDIVDRNPNLKPYRDGAVQSLQGSPQAKVPTLRLNVAVRQKKSGAA